jgi:hypothetical protein
VTFVRDKLDLVTAQAYFPSTHNTPGAASGYIHVPLLFVIVVSLWLNEALAKRQPVGSGFSA